MSLTRYNTDLFLVFIRIWHRSKGPLVLLSSGTQGPRLFASCSSTNRCMEAEKIVKWVPRKSKNAWTVCYPGIFITVWLLLWDLEAFMRLSGIADWFSELLVHYSFSNTFFTQIQLSIKIMVKAVSWKDILAIRFSNQKKEIHGKGLQAPEKSLGTTQRSPCSVIAPTVQALWFPLPWLHSDLLRVVSGCSSGSDPPVYLCLACMFLTWPPTSPPTLIFAFILYP